MTSPSLTSDGAGPARATRGIEEYHARVSEVSAISHGDPAIRLDSHALDNAFIDRERSRQQPLAPSVKEHHPAPDVAADIARGDFADRSDGDALSAPSLIFGGAVRGACRVRRRAPRRPRHRGLHNPRRSGHSVRWRLHFTAPSSISIGAGCSRSPRALSSNTPPPRRLPYPAAILPSDPEKLAHDGTLKLTSRGCARSRPREPSKSTTPLTPPVRLAQYPAAILPSGLNATLVTSPSLTAK